MHDQTKIPAVFVRGGTSKALIFRASDLPPLPTPGDFTPWVHTFLSAVGSPDPNGRQLNGMGGGISSLSKIAVVGPPTLEGADVDFTFGQVAIDDSVVGFRGNCGNISSAIGPYAVDEGLVKVTGDVAEVRIHNTNTKKIILARFPMSNGRAAVKGDFAIDGVAGTGARVELVFMNPGGATTGKLLPTGNKVDTISLNDFGEVEVSLVDAANPTVFVNAEALEITGMETPTELSRNAQFMHLSEMLRCKAALAMGLVKSIEEAQSTLKNLPLVALVTSPRITNTLDGRQIDADGMEILARMVSAGQPHKALPLTGAMCLAVAANIPGSVVEKALTNRRADPKVLRIGHPSGILSLAADVTETTDGIQADAVTVYRTARRLMEGNVFIEHDLVRDP